MCVYFMIYDKLCFLTRGDDINKQLLFLANSKDQNCASFAQFALLSVLLAAISTTLQGAE